MLREEFIEFNLKVLEKSNLAMHYTYAKTEEHMTEDNGVKRLIPIEIKPSQSMITNILERPFLGFICIFGVFDNYLEIKYPNIDKKNFGRSITHYQLIPLQK